MTLEVMPAHEGDCLLLTCHADVGDRHILIDGGTPSTADRLFARLDRLTPRRLELIIVSHIDVDHIGGIVRLFRNPEFDLEVGDTWFNGYRHLPKPTWSAFRAAADGERLTDFLLGPKGCEGRRELPWNLAFKSRAVARCDDDPRSPFPPLPEIRLPWGLTITILSPTPRRLAALLTGWESYLEALRAEQSSIQAEPTNYRSAGDAASIEALAALVSASDTAAPNGSSIAFLAEFNGRSVVFAADAFPTVLYPALSLLARRRGGVPDTAPQIDVPPLHVDVLKLPHHGSRANVSSTLFDVIRANHYVVSTSGKRFRHPDEEAMARVIVSGRPSSAAQHTLWFNYASPTTVRWLDPELKKRYDYATAGAVLSEVPGAILTI